MEICQVQLEKLKPWARNPRINAHAVDAVAESIRQFGFNVPILCDRDMTIIAGHVRWQAAKRLGMETVPVIQLELTSAQRDAFAVADNKTAEIADWDYAMLTDILAALPDHGIELRSLGFRESELDAILKPERDFDWEAFSEDLSDVQSTAVRVLLPVKVPIEQKQMLHAAIEQYAVQQAIHDEDRAVRAGMVRASLLGVAPWRNP